MYCKVKDSKWHMVEAELSLAGVLGVLWHPRNLEVLLTLFQPEGVDYAHHITSSTPGFGNLTTALQLGSIHI